jgi:hypothetical protein
MRHRMGLSKCHAVCSRLCNVSAHPTDPRHHRGLAMHPILTNFNQLSPLFSRRSPLNSQPPKPLWAAA